MLSAAPRSARLSLTLVFITFGTAVGAMAGSMPSIMRQAAMGSEAVGFGLTISTLTTVVAMSVGGSIARHASNRSVLLAVLPVFAVSLLAYLASPSPTWFVLSVLPLGFCFGLTDLFMNAEAVAIEHDMRRPVFTAFHGSVSSGVAAMAIGASFLSTSIAPTAVAVVTTALFALSFVLVWRSVPHRPLAQGKSSRMASLPNKAPLILLGVAAGLIIAAETAALLWSAKLLDEMAPALAAIAGLGAAFFGVCNAAIRFPGDILRRLAGDLPLMIGSLTVSILGFAALGLSQSFAASVVAFAVVGFGTALLIPCTFAMAAGMVPENRAGALSFVSMLTSVPRTLAPMAFGAVAAGLGTGFAFGLVAVGLTVALGLILVLQRTRRTG